MLLIYLRLNMRNSRSQIIGNGPFSAISEVFGFLIKNCKTVYTPGAYRK